MTLAAILLGVVFPLQIFRLQSMPVYAQTEPAPVAKSADPASAQGQSSAPPQNPPSSPAAPTSTSASPNASSNSRPPQRHKKKVERANCDSTSTAKTASGSTDSAPSAKSAADTTGGAGEGSASSNCPPKKKVVLQGGTSDTTIQLAGDASASPLPGTSGCHDANQCLKSAEQNLKKVSAQQLDSSKREMVSQVRQFMDQSRAATEAGDLDRARTLAWKAQTLSEELAAPKK